MKSQIYVETTIPSFYYEVQTEPEMMSRCRWTREWWDYHRFCYESFSSNAVISEFETGLFSGKSDALVLAKQLSYLEINKVIY